MELSKLQGIGPARLEALRAMGIDSLRDFLYALPVRYEDLTQPLPLAECMPGMPVLCAVTVEEDARLNRFSGLTRVTCMLRDASGRMQAAWFNQPWMAQKMKAGTRLELFGRVVEKNNRRVLQNAQVVEEHCLRPVYRISKSIPMKSYRELVSRALEHIDTCCYETLSPDLRREHGLCDLHTALKQAHFPDSMDALKEARRRLAFEQMLIYQAAVTAHSQNTQPAPALPIAENASDAFWKILPFPPTGAQQRVLQEIADDLRKPVSMSRLVQGDVGCGKTAIAFGAIAMTVGAGFQCAMMAPTEILARQHYASAQSMLEPLGIRCGLLTGSLRVKEKRAAHAALEAGEWNVVFGTHALISEGVNYRRLGLVITDEQHRFGVRQRSELQLKGDEHGLLPHVLVMSATPIPRTLALILYGDLQLSVVDELPPGRTPVKTRLVPAEKRNDMYAFLRSEVQQGRQAYVVCPLVEESELLQDVRSAKSTCEQLSETVLKGLRVGLTWGQQKADEKAAVLDAFSHGELDVLVSTTVIEVGVNVPNASVMVIENAERYGLSQLHQLRGRVGRGTAESWCFLLANSSEKLRVMTQTNDGFVIARKDLELRGPGDLMGTRQSGEAMNGFLLDGDVRLLDEAVRCINELRSRPDRKDELDRIEKEALLRYHGQIALN